MDLVVNQEYLEKRPLSFSAIKCFARSPKHYLSFLTAKRELPPPDMLFGSVVDCLLLTQDLFSKKFIIESISPFTVDGKARISEYLNKGITPIYQDVFEKAKQAVESVKQNPVSSKILNTISQTQRKLVWRDFETDLPLIAYLDGDSDDVIVEIKTAKSADKESFQRDAFNYSYPVQSAFYDDGFFYVKGKRPKNYYYIVVESSRPFGVSVFTATEEYMEYGKQQMRSLLNEFKYCLDNQEFDAGYEYKIPGGVHSLELPAWARSKVKKEE